MSTRIAIRVRKKALTDTSEFRIDVTSGSQRLIAIVNSRGGIIVSSSVYVKPCRQGSVSSNDLLPSSIQDLSLAVPVATAAGYDDGNVRQYVLATETSFLTIAVSIALRCC